MGSFEQSESINELAAALCKAQANMVLPTKSSNNPHFKSKFSPIDEVMEAARKTLNPHGISFVQPSTGNEDVVEVTLQLMHTSGQWMRSRTSVKLSKADPQGWASGLTYVLRRTIQAAIGMAAEDDDDGNAASASSGPTLGTNNRPIPSMVTGGAIQARTATSFVRPKPGGQ